MANGFLCCYADRIPIFTLNIFNRQLPTTLPSSTLGNQWQHLPSSEECERRHPKGLGWQELPHRTGRQFGRRWPWHVLWCQSGRPLYIYRRRHPKDLGWRELPHRTGRQVGRQWPWHSLLLWLKLFGR